MEKKYSQRLIILFLFLANFLVGALFINEGLFHHDSAVMAQAIDTFYRQGTIMEPAMARYGALFINGILHLPFFLSGNSAEATVRFSGILFHALSIVILFVFLDLVLGSRVQAAFSALLFSFTPFYFSPNTYGKEEGMMMFFFLFSFYLLCRGIAKRSAILLCMAGIVFMLAATIKESVFIFTPLFLLFYFLPVIMNGSLPLSLKEKFRPRLLLSLIAPLAGLFCSIYFFYFKKVIYATAINEHTAYIKFLGFNSALFTFALKDLSAGIPLLIFALALIGLIKMLKEKKIALAVFFTCWFMFLFYFGNLNIYTSRYLGLVVIPFYVFSSYALFLIYKKSKVSSLLFVGYFILSMFFFSYPMLSFRHHFNGEKRFAFKVKHSTAPEAVIIAADEAPFISYYAKRQVLTPPQNTGEQIRDFIMAVRGYIRAGRPVYLIESVFRDNRSGRFEEAMERNFLFQPVGRYLNEDYHRPDLQFCFFFERLFRIAVRDV
jgi:hypothetical protein